MTAMRGFARRSSVTLEPTPPSPPPPPPPAEPPVDEVGECRGCHHPTNAADSEPILLCDGCDGEFHLHCTSHTALPPDDEPFMCTACQNDTVQAKRVSKRESQRRYRAKKQEKLALAAWARSVKKNYANIAPPPADLHAPEAEVRYYQLVSYFQQKYPDATEAAVIKTALEVVRKELHDAEQQPAVSASVSEDEVNTSQMSELPLSLLSIASTVLPPLPSALLPAPASSASHPVPALVVKSIGIPSTPESVKMSTNSESVPKRRGSKHDARTHDHSEVYDNLPPLSPSTTPPSEPTPISENVVSSPPSVTLSTAPALLPLASSSTAPSQSSQSQSPTESDGPLRPTANRSCHLCNHGKRETHSNISHLVVVCQVASCRKIYCSRTKCIERLSADYGVTNIDEFVVWKQNLENGASFVCPHCRFGSGCYGFQCLQKSKSLSWPKASDSEDEAMSIDDDSAAAHPTDVSSLPSITTSRLHRSKPRCSNSTCDGASMPADKSLLSVCSGCLTAAYCSRECQTKHWKGGHKQECNRVQRERESQSSTPQPSHGAVSAVRSLPAELQADIASFHQPSEPTSKLFGPHRSWGPALTDASSDFNTNSNTVARIGASDESQSSETTLCHFCDYVGLKYTRTIPLMVQCQTPGCSKVYCSRARCMAKLPPRLKLRNRETFAEWKRRVESHETEFHCCHCTNEFTCRGTQCVMRRQKVEGPLSADSSVTSQQLMDALMNHETPISLPVLGACISTNRVSDGASETPRAKRLRIEAPAATISQSSSTASHSSISPRSMANNAVVPVVTPAITPRDGDSDNESTEDDETVCNRISGDSGSRYDQRVQTKRQARAQFHDSVERLRSLVLVQHPNNFRVARKVVVDQAIEIIEKSSRANAELKQRIQALELQLTNATGVTKCPYCFSHFRPESGEWDMSVR